MNHLAIGCWNVRGLAAASRILDCRKLIKDFHLDLVCLLETKLNSITHQSHSSLHNLSLFQSESSASNFDCSSGGRIWIKWHSERIHFELISKPNQLIHGRVNILGSHSFLLTCVYAENEARLRTSLWSSLCDIAGSSYSPWIIMGDFNCPLTSKDKKGGNSIALNNSLEFKDCINHCGLIELPSTGLYYTWYNQQVDKPIFSKLDGVFCNVEWLESFPFSFYKVTPPLTSDQSPLVTFLQPPTTSPHRFLFRNYWSSNPSFLADLKIAWGTYIQGDPMYNLSNKLKAVKAMLKNRYRDPTSLADQIKVLKLDQEGFTLNRRKILIILDY